MRSTGTISLLIPSGKQARHLNDGGVEDVENELRRDADREHEERDRNNDELLASQKIGKDAATIGERTAEERLHRAHKHDGRDEKTDDSNGRERSGDGERTFEDQKFADESVQSGQTERGKHGNAHPAAEQRSALHQSAEIVDAAQAAPLLEQTDKIEQRGGGDAVVEDLHEDAAQRRLHVDRRCVDLVRDREETEHAVAEMIDRQIGRPSVSDRDWAHAASEAKDDRANRKAEQPWAEDFDFVREKRKQQADETVNAHFREHAGQHHRNAGGRGFVGVRQPGVKRKERHFDREAEKDPGKYEPRDIACEQAVLPQIRRVRRNRMFLSQNKFRETRAASRRCREKCKGKILSRRDRGFRRPRF